MSVWLLYLIICLATYSATRFLVADQFPPVRVTREWLKTTLHPVDPETRLPVRYKQWPMRAVSAVFRSIAYLITCEWCMSFWVGGAIIWATCQYTSVPLPWLLLAVARAVTGWLANLEGWCEQRWLLNRARTWMMQDDLEKRGIPVK